jgi:hypothetical protein
LDKDIFELLRSKELHKFKNLLIEIYKKKGKRDFTDLEKQSLMLFSNQYATFSLMFRIILKTLNLHPHD